MSLLDSLRETLDAMGFLQLGLAFAALLAYSIALAPSFSGVVRGSAAVSAFLCAAGFAAASPHWAAGVLTMTLGVAAFGLFAGAAWLLARMLGVVETRGRLAADLPFAIAGWGDGAPEEPPVARRGRAAASVRGLGPATVPAHGA